MARNFKALALIVALLAPASALAQSGCGGQSASGMVCGNSAATTGLPSLGSVTNLLDRAMGNAQGRVLARGAGGWASTPNPTLGINGTVGGAITLNGATSGSATIRVPAAAGGTVFQLPPTNGTNGFVLTTDGAGNTSWLVNTAGGTVQSVGLSMPGIFTVTNSPVTLTGTLTATLATQTANLVWAGPTTGAAAPPTFRALVGADLPNPSGSTLGGVQSFAAVGSQWIRQISTSGVPTASQPAFADISGTLAPAQCPNPSASTIGCVQSLAFTAARFISSVTTAGVPVATQPGFSDLSGSATLGQLPSISNQTVLGNNSGGTAIPSALSATNVLDFLGTTQGQILYRNASAWVPLSPGTGGQVLTTGGAAANPAWATVTGTGTVTNVASGTGLTGGPVTTTGTLSLANISAGTVLANTTVGSTTPSGNTPSAVLDVIGSTTGNMLYRSSGSGWQALAPGTNGQVLTQGVSTPSWANVGTLTNVTIAAGNGINVSGTCNISTSGTCTVATNAVTHPQGRITLVANQPVMNTVTCPTTSCSNLSTVRYDCYNGKYVPYFDGSADQLDAIGSCEVSLTMVSAASAGQTVNNNLYDVWWVHGGANRICLAMSSAVGGGGGWSSDAGGGSNTARGTGYTQIDLVTRGYSTNKNSITNCFNGATNYGPVSANQGTYLGTIATVANGQTSFYLGGSASGGSAPLLYVWNAHNRLNVVGTTIDNGASYTYTSGSFRMARASSGNSINFISGLAEEAMDASYTARADSTSPPNSLYGYGVGLDGSAAPVIQNFVCQPSTTVCSGASNNLKIPPLLGGHFITAIEASDGTHANTFDAGSLNALQALMRM